MSQEQFVVFALGAEEYGIKIGYTQEIIRIPEKITKMPNLPSHVEGVFSLRGKVVPIIDLKKRYDLEQGKHGIDRRLLVLSLEEMMMGIIVDDVSEVLKIEAESIEEMGEAIYKLGGESISGIARVEERLVLLLDAKKMKTEIMGK